MRYAEVLLDGHLAGRYPYRIPADVTVERGDWALVPWGRQQRVGIVSGTTDEVAIDPGRVRELVRVLRDLPAMPADWFRLLEFAAGYYHVHPAELALTGVPKLLRTPPRAKERVTPADRLAAFDGRATDPGSGRGDGGLTLRPLPSTAPALTDEQQAVVAHLIARDGESRPTLIHGVTGSGKTEVYLGWLAHLLATREPGQVLVLVPEIGLTPALARQLRARFPTESIAVLHSDMPEAQRASHWLAAATGTARLVIGTRSAAWVPLPALTAIVVDEEHDPSFKQQEGVRFSSRDLAVSRAALARVPIALGSATPSLESWFNARRGRYDLLTLTKRPSRGAAVDAGTATDTDTLAGTGAGAETGIKSGPGPRPGTADTRSLARIERVPMDKARTRHGLAEPVIDAVAAAIARGEQALVYLNRRGYSPVLSCQACGWLSRCDQCDAYRVVHREARSAPGAGRPAYVYRLVCHHCASERPAPRRCPECGNQDLATVGRGTQRLEEGLNELFPGARIARLDRDVSNRRGAAAAILAAAHAGEVDLLVGTQMLAKGHDFERLTQVVVADADAGLFASDFRAPERLFATLLQVSGRAGRHRPAHATTWVQTRHPDHPLFNFVIREDYPGFAEAQLAEREAQTLPPYAHQALLLAWARKPELALGFLQQARERLATDAEALAVTLCDPVPMPLARLRAESRYQLLIEAGQRRALHRLVDAASDRLATLATNIGGGLGWTLVIDPQEI